MLNCKKALFVLSYLLLSALAQSPPKASYPYATTMLRTHHFKTETFLSIYEEMCANVTDDGALWTAVNIEIGWPFSIRDAADTHVNGIRVVYRYDKVVQPTTYSMWYYMTDLDGQEHCVASRTVDLNPATMGYLGKESIRNILSEGWINTDTVTGVNTTNWYTEDLNGYSFLFRTESVNPSTSKSAEYGWLLDYGTNFAVLKEEWFYTGGCNTNTHPWSALPWSTHTPQPNNPWTLFYGY